MKKIRLLSLLTILKIPKKKKHLYKLVGKKLPEREDDAWYSIFPVENEQLVYGR